MALLSAFRLRFLRSPTLKMRRGRRMQTMGEKKKREEKGKKKSERSTVVMIVMMARKRKNASCLNASTKPDDQRDEIDPSCGPEVRLSRTNDSLRRLKDSEAGMRRGKEEGEEKRWVKLFLRLKVM